MHLSRACAGILLLTLILPFSTGCAGDPSLDDSRIALIQGDRLEGWLATDQELVDDWIQAGGASPDPSDPRRLVVREGTGILVNGKAGNTRHLMTEKKFGDVEAHIEFMVPQGSNSGVYFMGRYEVQILDSYGKKSPTFADCGGIYQRWDPSRGEGKEGFEGRAPAGNASLAPGAWQTLDVIFSAPRFDERGLKTANARFERVAHNGVLIHENVEVTGPTRAAIFTDERPTGPLMLQGDHGPVVFRNCWIASLAPACASGG